ncbi:formate dehydrogenase accessory sulfurtransferase FdhD [Desulfoplanes formicivorans]|uniref:Formate dehydrogenase subunit FdhD n=1 Tax=Desulfoplanes formicivorans TaxID=1592317 RepID=A0A194AHW0_9BACT|nr:formate dehydrogenase accessory sulfurtransferase FdhD [Desulfoplanes formicivorans]GAU08810.1 formate dehydrogenase subunit FdhD [Desulfoplanes formicivorans]
MTSSLIPARPYDKFHGNSWHRIEDTVTRETRIHLAWPNRSTTLWAFPRDLDHLALGHALVEWCSPNQIPCLRQTEHDTFHLDPCPREYPAGGRNFEPVSPPTILGAMNRFFSRTGLWETTGCFHRMALFDPHTDTIIHFVEDIARHNCIDRLAGWSVQAACPLKDKVLLCSSRVTGSLMTKICLAGLPMVVSQSATTMAAIDMAADHGITLLGFARTSRFTVFCDPADHARVAKI